MVKFGSSNAVRLSLLVIAGMMEPKRFRRYVNKDQYRLAQSLPASCTVYLIQKNVEWQDEKIAIIF
ncbi:hypothetical protein DF209_07820 [Pectobacterium polaris]|nr:hypothetical protein DF209_07820 [Pectobacterium polaris]